MISYCFLGSNPIVRCSISSTTTRTSGKIQLQKVPRCVIVARTGFCGVRLSVVPSVVRPKPLYVCTAHQNCLNPLPKPTPPLEPLACGKLSLFFPFLLQFKMNFTYAPDSYDDDRRQSQRQGQTKSEKTKGKQRQRHQLVT